MKRLLTISILALLTATQSVDASSTGEARAPDIASSISEGLAAEYHVKESRRPDGTIVTDRTPIFLVKGAYGTYPIKFSFINKRKLDELKQLILFLAKKSGKAGSLDGATVKFRLAGEALETDRDLQKINVESTVHAYIYTTA